MTESTEAQETVNIVENEFSKTFGADVIPIFISANSAVQMQSQLQEKIQPNDKIIRLLFLGHGISSSDELKIQFEHGKSIVVRTNDTNLKAHEYFEPINGKFADGAFVHFSNCNLFAGTIAQATQKASKLRSVLGLTNGFLYANKTQGDTFNYLKGAREMLNARPERIAFMLLPAYLVLAATLNPYWTSAMTDRLSELLIIPVVIAADIIITYLRALRMNGYLFEIKNRIVQSDFTKITEFLNYRTNVLGGNSLRCQALFL